MPHVDVTSETPEIVAACKWWGDVLRKGAQFDNGDKTFAGTMSMSMASMNRKVIPEEIITKFEKQLAEDFAAYINKQKCWHPDNPDWKGYVRAMEMHVDYNPSSMLADALQKAGWDKDCGLTTFPWKTSVHCDPGSVKVAMGYGARHAQIYPPVQEPSNVPS